MTSATTTGSASPTSSTSVILATRSLSSSLRLTLPTDSLDKVATTLPDDLCCELAGLLAGFSLITTSFLRPSEATGASTLSLTTVGIGFADECFDVGVGGPDCSFSCSYSCSSLDATISESSFGYSS